MTKHPSRIDQLASNILHHNKLYYNGTPELSDLEYDILVDELRILQPDHPVLNLVGQDSSTVFAKTEHIMPMTSQNKATQSTDFLKWALKVQYPKYIVQYKLDGISVELQFLNGRFKLGVSRGDGRIGDDITQNVKKMNGIPMQVDSNFSGAVRGEILLYNSEFDQYFSDQKNPRNTASGLAKRKDGKGCEHLTIVSYDAMNVSIPFSDEFKKLKWLEENGFSVVETKIFTESAQVVQFREEVIKNLRDKLEFDIDGLVVKGPLIDWEDMKRAKPMKQIAYKFPPNEMITTVIDVEWSHSGSIYSPVGIVEPVEIAGTTVQRASLSNPDQINFLGLKIGSKVVIVKRGEIIPKIERVVSTPETATRVTAPTECSSCNSKLINIGTKVYCPNEQCPRKELHRLRRWISMLGIKNFGEKLIEQLYNAGKLQKIAEFYALKVSDITSLPRQGVKSAEKALKNLLAVKEIPIAVFIGGFDIEGVSKTLVEPVIAAGFNTLEKIRDARVNEIAQINRYGEINSNMIITGIKDLYNDMIDVLNQGKISIQSPDHKEEGKVAGKSFCFTGKLNAMSRDEGKKLVEEQGGSFKSSVTKGLDYLVTNTPNSGSSKNEKARQYGTIIITEAEFLELVT